MESVYNITKLEDIIKEIVLKSLKLSKDMQLILSNLIEEKDCIILDLKSKELLSHYSKEAIHYTLEKMVLLSLENNCPCWNLLKNKTEEMRTRCLSHFFITFINDLRNNSFTYEETNDISEIRDLYNKKIESHMDVLSDELKETINQKQSITLNHMHNLNANGRTVSLNGTKVGGLFLSKDSNIGYAKFVNKKELLNSFKISENKKEIVLKGGTIKIYDFKRIINSLNQTVKVEKNTNIKNQDARLISTGDKKVGSLFLGNKGIELDNGTYISIDELNFALSDYLRKKEQNSLKGPNVVVNRKGKIKKIVAVAALASSFFGMIPNHVSALGNVEQLQEEKVDEDLIIKEINKKQISHALNEEIKPVEIKEPTVSSNMVIENEIIEEDIIENIKSVEESVSSNEIVEKNIPSVSENEIQEFSLEKKDKVIEENKKEIVPKMEEVEPTNIIEDYSKLEEPETVQAESGQDIVNYALQFVGNPYVYGGESLTNGADCSGFTGEVYSRFGIELPRTSDNQRNIGIDVEGLENALPGDLICYSGHVAIYIGDGNIVHAANSMDGIKISKATCEEILAIKRLIDFENIKEGQIIGK